MQVKRHSLSETAVKLEITAGRDEMAKFRQLVLEQLAQEVKVPGFREGKAPLALVEKQLDQNRLQTTFLEEAINQLYPAAIRELQLRPVAQPNVSVVKFVPFDALEFAAEVEAVGDFTLPDYKKIKKTAAEVKVTTKDVDEVIKALRTRTATRQEVDRAAKNGDEVWIDFNGVDSKGAG